MLTPLVHHIHCADLLVLRAAPLRRLPWMVVCGLLLRTAGMLTPLLLLTPNFLPGSLLFWLHRHPGVSELLYIVSSSFS